MNRVRQAVCKVLTDPTRSKKAKVARGESLSRRVGRRKPYTDKGIRRLRCQRCSASATATWNCCANDNLHIPLCLDCDIELNRLTMEFFKIPRRAGLLRKYVRMKHAEETV